MPEEENEYDAVERAQARKDQEDPWVMYLIVRESLGMSAGKIGAQCGHAVGMTYEKYIKLKKDLGDMRNQVKNDTVDQVTAGLITKATMDAINYFNCWRQESYRKVVLRASDKEWDKIKAELSCFGVRDAGFTEVAAGSETVIGIWPMRKSAAPKIIKKLQALK
jgi:peptidyl-tRNA hydrolase